MNGFKPISCETDKGRTISSNKWGPYQQKVAELNREVQEKQRELQDEFRRQVGERCF